MWTQHLGVCEKTKSKPRKIFDAVHKLWKTDAEVNTRWISAWFMCYVKLSGGEESFGEEKLGEEETDEEDLDFDDIKLQDKDSWTNEDPAQPR